MRIAQNTVVSFHYAVATAEGELVDKSTDQPLVYLHGNAQIIAGLEEALAGHDVGEHIEATVPPEKAYGSYDPGLDLRIPLDAFPEDARGQLEPGFRFMAEHPQQENERVMFTVHGVEEGAALVSGNHPLAGQTLMFTVDIVEVRAATADEITHGHAHGPGGHHHH